MKLPSKSVFAKNILFYTALFLIVADAAFAAGEYSSYCSASGKITEYFCGDKSPGNQWVDVGSDCYTLERKEVCDTKINPAANGCTELSIIYKLAKIDKEMFDLSMIQLTKERACSGMYAAGQTIRYQNGRVAGTTGGIGRWYYPNGQEATDFSFDSLMARIYYPDATLATSSGVSAGGRWYYPQQSDITNNAGRKNATYYRLYSGMPYNQSPAFIDNKNKINLNLFLDYILSLNGILPN